MNKYMKKLAAGLLAFALMGSCCCRLAWWFHLRPAENFRFPDPTASVGDQISVTMKIAADASTRFLRCDASV